MTQTVKWHQRRDHRRRGDRHRRAPGLQSTPKDIQSIPRWFIRLRRFFQEVPLLGWLMGGLAAVLAEQFVGLDLAHMVDRPKIPVLFGFENALKKPELIFGTVLFILHRKS